MRSDRVLECDPRLGLLEILHYDPRCIASLMAFAELWGLSLDDEEDGASEMDAILKEMRNLSKWMQDRSKVKLWQTLHKFQEPVTVTETHKVSNSPDGGFNVESTLGFVSERIKLKASGTAAEPQKRIW